MGLRSSVSSTSALSYGQGRRSACSGRMTGQFRRGKARPGSREKLLRELPVQRRQPRRQDLDVADDLVANIATHLAEIVMPFFVDGEGEGDDAFVLRLDESF